MAKVSGYLGEKDILKFLMSGQNNENSSVPHTLSHAYITHHLSGFNWLKWAQAWEFFKCPQMILMYCPSISRFCANKNCVSCIGKGHRALR